MSPDREILTALLCEAFPWEFRSLRHFWYARFYKTRKQEIPYRDLTVIPKAAVPTGKPVARTPGKTLPVPPRSLEAHPVDLRHSRRRRPDQRPFMADSETGPVGGRGFARLGY